MQNSVAHPISSLLPLDVLAKRVRREIIERDHQGYDVQGLMEHWHQVQHDRRGLVMLHERMASLAYRLGWHYIEPSSLDEIRAKQNDPMLNVNLHLSETEIANKIHGGFLGRSVGCILGKPLEMGYSQDDIRDYLEGANAYPLQDYVPAQSRSGKVLRRDCVPSMLGYVSYAQEDDDLNYMCLALKLLETYGFDFTTLDVGVNWLQSMPFMWTWGPEHVMYLHLAAAIGEHSVPQAIDLEHLTRSFNPGIEWIGAQIRTDVYGYVCPGNLERAVELAWRDAYLTHRGNGVYGAIWVAAMASAAFVLDDVQAVIQAGLSHIPTRSRFFEAINNVVKWYREGLDWQAIGHEINHHYGHYGMEGTINNACCVAAALLCGCGDAKAPPAVSFERTITTAVQLGFDTDCNGATAGSIAGLIIGGSMLPEKWTNPLQDTLRTCVSGFGQVRISDIARRGYELSRIDAPRVQKVTSY